MIVEIDTGEGIEHHNYVCHSKMKRVLAQRGRNPNNGSIQIYNTDLFPVDAMALLCYPSDGVATKQVSTARGHYIRMPRTCHHFMKGMYYTLLTTRCRVSLLYFNA